MDNNYQNKRMLLLHYLQLYLSKKLRMNVVLIGIVNELKSNHQISIKQFNSLIKFLEREPKFINRDRDYILKYFEPLIRKENTYEPNTLCQFL